jgi:hypothetical protein
MLVYNQLLPSQFVMDSINFLVPAEKLVRGGFGVALVPYAPRLAATLGDLSIVDVPPGLEETSIAVMHREDLYPPRYGKRFKELAASVIRQSIRPSDVPATAANKR